MFFNWLFVLAFCLSWCFASPFFFSGFVGVAKRWVLAPCFFYYLLLFFPHSLLRFFLLFLSRAFCPFVPYAHFHLYWILFLCFLFPCVRLFFVSFAVRCFRACGFSRFVAFSYYLFFFSPFSFNLSIITIVYFLLDRYIVALGSSLVRMPIAIVFLLSHPPFFPLLCNVSLIFICSFMLCFFFGGVGKVVLPLVVFINGGFASFFHHTVLCWII